MRPQSCLGRLKHHLAVRWRMAIAESSLSMGQSSQRTSLSRLPFGPFFEPSTNGSASFCKTVSFREVFGVYGRCVVQFQQAGFPEFLKSFVGFAIESGSRMACCTYCLEQIQPVLSHFLPPGA